MVHHTPRLLAATLLLGTLLLGTLGLGLPAYARMTPTPKPSGIVIHVFGPDSITSHIMSIGPTTPAPAGTKPGGAGGTTTTGTAAAGTAAADTAATAPATAAGPTMGDVMHQMFITGDPAQENGNAKPKGKAGN